MKKATLVTLCTLLLLLLIARLSVFDVVSVPQGRCPQAGSWALVNRWAYGYRLPWNVHKRWNSKTVKLCDWVAYNRPLTDRDGEPDTTAICIGRCIATPGDTLWYSNESGRVNTQQDRRNGFIHPLVVPQKGVRMPITNDNLRFYAITIMLHEPVKATIVNDSLCVSGNMLQEYAFQQDYYWMTTDDPKNPLDSRTFGFVPQVSLIGRIL